MAAAEGLTSFSAVSSVSITDTAAGVGTVYFLDMAGVTHLRELIDETFATKEEAQAGVIPGGKIWIE